MEGNIAVQGTLSGGVGFPGGSVALYMTFTDAPLYENLEGSGIQVGGSISHAVSLGIDFVFVPNGEEPGFTGLSVLLGIGYSPVIVEGHAEFGITWTLLHGNIFEALEELKIEDCYMHDS